MCVISESGHFLHWLSEPDRPAIAGLPRACLCPWQFMIKPMLTRGLSSQSAGSISAQASAGAATHGALRLVCQMISFHSVFCVRAAGSWSWTSSVALGHTANMVSTHTLWSLCVSVSVCERENDWLLCSGPPLHLLLVSHCYANALINVLLMC